MSINPLQKIVILGGGSAGWIAAAMLAHQLRRDLYQIELVESADISTIGVGESTLPPFVQLLQRLGIDQQDFIQATQACFKLGIKFVDWRQRQHSFFHPFGAIGAPIANQDFFQCWLKAKQYGDESELQDFSPAAVMAGQQRFFPPAQLRQSPIGSANFAIHLDAKKVANYLRDYSVARGVIHTQGTVAQVRKNAERIESLGLSDGRDIGGDFFIDCSGFSAKLIEQALQAGFDDWSDLLPCDRALVVRTEAQPETLAFTTATAHKFGWSWRIPLRKSLGHGYVYASRYCSDAEAKTALMRQLDCPRISDPQLIPFSCGKRRAIWKSNCVALGLAAGFIEPLESTSLHLIVRGMEYLLRYFPDRDCDPSLQREYNRRMAADFTEVRDFILLHYWSSQRDDSPFWRSFKTRPLPESLQERIELFRAHGILRDGPDELFRSTSWQSVFEGMGIRPAKYCPRVDNLELDTIVQQLQVSKRALMEMIQALPSHDAYLQKNYR